MSLPLSLMTRAPTSAVPSCFSLRTPPDLATPSVIRASPFSLQNFHCNTGGFHCNTGDAFPPKSSPNRPKQECLAEGDSIDKQRVVHKPKSAWGVSQRCWELQQDDSSTSCLLQAAKPRRSPARLGTHGSESLSLAVLGVRRGWQSRAALPGEASRGSSSNREWISGRKILEMQGFGF